MSRIQSLAALILVGLLIIGGALWIVWIGGISFETRTPAEQARAYAEKFAKDIMKQAKPPDAGKQRPGGQPTPAGPPAPAGNP